MNFVLVIGYTAIGIVTTTILAFVAYWILKAIDKIKLPKIEIPTRVKDVLEIIWLILVGCFILLLVATLFYAIGASVVSALM